MELQYILITQNLNKGIRYFGVFHSLEGAMRYRNTLKGCTNHSIHGEHGDKEYGVTETKFDVDDFWSKQKKWIGDHQVSGRD